MPTPGDIICGDVRLEALAPASLGAEVFQPVFVARRGDAGEPIWLTVVDGAYTPTSMNMSTFMAGANGMLGLRHPALVRVVLVDREMDYSVVGYEALPGAESMTDVVTSGASRILLARTALEVARGLAFLHRRDMLHGALTPSTVVMWEGVPVLWEHGIAALCSHTVFGPRASQLGGDVVAPEVRAGAKLTPATDVFAWGAVLSSVATGVLGPEAVASVVSGEVEEGRQGPLFDLIREALAPEPVGRPRDGTHLLERLLALEEAPRPAPATTAREAGSAEAVDAVDDEDLSNLARRYLAEMSEVEGRTKPARPSSPPSLPDAEASGALARVKLRKAKVPTGAFRPAARRGKSESSGATIKPPAIGAAKAKSAVPSRPAVPQRPTTEIASPGDPSPEDSAAQGVPLWKAASESRPRRVDPRTPQPTPAPTLTPQVPTDGAAPSLGTIEDAPKMAPQEPDEDAVAAEAELRNAFLELTQAADGQVQPHASETSNPLLVGVPDDPTAAPAAAPAEDRAPGPSYGGPDDDADTDVFTKSPTPVPTRPPDLSTPPATGGWMRASENEGTDPNAAVETRLPPAQDIGDGVHKRTFAAPHEVAEDPTPEEPIVVDRKTVGQALPEGEDPSGKHDVIAREVLADLQREGADPKAAKKAAKEEAKRAKQAKQAKQAKPEAELPPPPAPDAGPDALPPPEPRPARAEPVKPFRPPRTPGPHGPSPAILTGLLVTLMGLVPVAATLEAADQRGRFGALLSGSDPDGDGAGNGGADGAGERGGTDAAAGGDGGEGGCPADMVALPSAGARQAGDSYVCIDVAEMPGKGQIPATKIDFAEAEQRCEERGRRLCTKDEWTLACGGVEGRSQPYGTEAERGRCRTSAKGELAASGTTEGCVTPEGAFDLVGNAAEWVAEGIALGGSASTRSATCSTKLRPGKRAKRDGIGARCCVDVIP